MINQKAHSQTLYMNDSSHGFMAYSGYSDYSGLGSSIMAGAGYAIKRKLDLSIEYSMVDSGVDGGYWATQPEKSHIYSGSITLYPIKEGENRSVTGQVTVASGWTTNSNSQGPLIGVSGGFSKRSTLSENLMIIPRVMLNYGSIVAEENANTLAFSHELGVLIGFSSGITLLINPMLIFEIEDQNTYAGIVLGLVI